MKCNCNLENEIVGSTEVKKKKEMLEKISSREMGWTFLFKCKMCNTFWELTYPHSEYHGGGEPLLTKVDSNYVVQNYPGKQPSSK